MRRLKFSKPPIAVYLANAIQETVASERSYKNLKPFSKRKVIAISYLYKKPKMLLNISHDYSSKKEKIDTEVGKTFTLAERKKWEGISHQNIPITAASIDIYNFLTANGKENTCSIEMRPKGIIISFRSMQETYALVIPNYKLKVYKGKAEEYSFYKDQHFIKIWAGSNDPEIHQFVKKIIKNKSDNAPTRVDDL